MEARALAAYLKAYDGPEVKIMEVCGTHTAAIFKSGLRSLLSPRIRLISGPGCPVCVTPTAFVDRCVAYAMEPNTVLMSFGDMLKVPGAEMSLADAPGAGGRVEIMYAPTEVVERAKANPGTRYVVAAPGFETTAPAFALAVAEAERAGAENVLFVTALKSVVPALAHIAENEPDIDGFICPGHVSVVTGTGVFEDAARTYGRPFVVAGFEGEHILAAVGCIVRAKASGADRGFSRNFYPSAVRAEGNARAREQIARFFEPGCAVWRGLGGLTDSGFYLRPAYARFDGGSRDASADRALPAGCRCADVITGRADPTGCPMFGAACLPETPVGPCMVSAEGACGIWYRNRA